MAPPQSLPIGLSRSLENLTRQSHPQLQAMMPDIGPTQLLIKLKVAASSLITNISQLSNVNETWQTDEEELQNAAIDIGVKYDFVATELQHIKTLTEQLLNGPPSYDASPHEREHHFLELQIVCDRAYNKGVDAKNALDAFCDMTMEADGSDMSLVEASLRAETAMEECCEMVSWAKTLVQCDSESTRT
ncbi:hypothetical protein LTR37_003931 [Vermiconidia calcicola]|uniref:Uncharacterized protein n=1 Tax=Vermiconidia calcicola TaxID=1690605 RepID=A0ACC3NNA3_9PEZI|nr:hypothetical protein LTR37_003931 [Vermiconidia calcicola]